jgi:hypothetical protein
MAYTVNGMNVDLHNNAASVNITNQPATPPNAYVNINVNFGITDDDRRTEGEMEQKFRQRAKALLLEAANSL